MGTITYLRYAHRAEQSYSCGAEKKRRLPFSVPSVWKEPAGPDDCLTQVLGFSRKFKSNIIYPDNSSIEDAVPDFHQAKPHPSANSLNENDASMDEGSLYSAQDEDDKRELLAQNDVAEVTRKFKFSQRQAEKFCSTMNQEETLQRLESKRERMSESKSMETIEEMHLRQELDRDRTVMQP
ncbi:hypothetical protein DMENIID0001_037840 [Sergentomyia squamirostris]